MRRVVVSIGLRLGLALVMVHSVVAQAPGANVPMKQDALPGFDVATIKPSNPEDTRGWGFEVDGAHVTAVNATVENMLVSAYGIHPKQIVGGPEWLRTAKYDVNGVPDTPGDPNLRQVQEMYRKLLADRFHLTFHHEVRTIPIYALTVAKGGPLLKVADPNEHFNAGNSGSVGHATMKFTSMSMQDFALNLNFYQDRPVINQTGLTGKYDFTLKWTYDMTKEADPDAPPSLYTALKDQLGLRLDAVKGPADVLVIDTAERPSGN